MLLLFYFSYFQYILCHKHFNLKMFIKSDTAILTKTLLPEGIFFPRQQHQQFYSYNEVVHYYYN